MDPVTLVIVGSGLASAAIGTARTLAERRRVRRELAASPQLGTLTPEGTLVRVTGVVRKRDTLIVAPLSGAECVAARARITTGVWQLRGAMRPREWFAIVSFVLDRGGEPPVIVEGEHARIALPPEKLARAKAGSHDLARREQLLLQLGEKATNAFRAGCEEIAIVPGMRVSIAGVMMLDVPVAAPPGDGERGFRDLPATTMRLVGNATHPLVIGSPIA
ncbi:MAG TPA: hypothetical protein VH143_25360 [Kofleriaceae bacterium]|nr:hypothetical protein [Kofleriaceae bacterium]